LEILDRYNSTVTHVLTGHYHHSAFQLTQSNIPIFIHYGITPNFGNCPGFRYYVATGLVISTYRDFVYTEELSLWEIAIDFKKEYNIDQINQSLLLRKLENGTVDIIKYLKVTYNLRVADSALLWKLATGRTNYENVGLIICTAK
jgi:hypothetical protein